jgi:ribosomal protein L21E
MSTWKDGDKVRIVRREVTADDRKGNRYFEHMAGLTGTVTNVYSRDSVAVMINKETLSKVAASVHEEATRRMREKFMNNASEEAKAKLTPEELKFAAHYMLLVHGEDLEKA